MRWCTSTWSPMAKSGTSPLICVSSMSCINLFFMAPILPLLGWLLLTTSPGLPAPGPGLLLAPLGDGLMVAAQQNLWHCHIPKDARPGVLRIFHLARSAVRFLLHALCVSKDSRHVAHY